MKFKVWEKKNKLKEFDESLIKKYELLDLTVDVLKTRNLCENFKGFSLEELIFCKKFDSYESLKDVFVTAFRIKQAINNKEKIAVFADYDCDGICSAAILQKFFNMHGVKILVHIPEREEGYGLNCEIIEKFKKEDVSLIITVDNGVVAFDEAEKIAEYGIDLIIIDHHIALEKLPKAVAVVNPKRKDDCSKFKEICGAFVVFKLIAAVEEKTCEEIFEYYGDLLTIATIADVMPIVYENKLIVEKGLNLIKKTDNLGLKFLMELIFKQDKELVLDDIAFFICPKINAAGRLNRAKDAFKLLICEDFFNANILAKKIYDYNNIRKNLEEKMFKEAVEGILTNVKELSENLVVVFKENWLVGLTGLVAAKLCSLYGKPAIVLTKVNDLLIGSARSFEGFSIYDALKDSSELFLRWGGHNLAGGLTLKEENFNKFKEKIYRFAKDNKPKEFKIKIDCEISPKIDILAINNLQKIGPFGHYNKEPVFLIKAATLTKIISLKGNEHLKLEFCLNGIFFYILCFGFKRERFYFKLGEKFNILTTVFVNCYNGVETVNFKMVDFRPYSLKQMDMLKYLEEYETLLEYDEKSMDDKFLEKLPNREDFIFVFNFFKGFKVFRGNIYEAYLLIFKKINFFKLLIIFKVFVSIGILVQKEDGIYFIETMKKIELNKNMILKFLRS